MTEGLTEALNTSYDEGRRIGYEATTVKVIYNFPSAQPDKVNSKHVKMPAPKIQNFRDKIELSKATRKFLEECGRQLRVPHLRHLFQSPNEELLDVGEILQKNLEVVYVSISPVLLWQKQALLIPKLLDVDSTFE